MAVDYLSAINRQGSGLNITEIVDSLVEAETAPQVDKIQKEGVETKEQLNTEIQAKQKELTEILMKQVQQIKDTQPRST